MRALMLAITTVMVVTAFPLTSAAQMGGMGGQHMMGYSQQQPPLPQNQQQAWWGGYGMMPQMGGYGMMPGMIPRMGGYGTMPHMMSGYGMGSPQMMMGWAPSGPAGVGVVPCQGPYGQGPCVAGTADIQKYNDFLDRTRDLRRDLHMKMFEYMEAQRDPKSGDAESIGRQITELQKKVYSAWSTEK